MARPKNKKFDKFKCVNCGEVFQPSCTSGKSMFCKPSCYWNYRKGKKFNAGALTKEELERVPEMYEELTDESVPLMFLTLLMICYNDCMIYIKNEKSIKRDVNIDIKDVDKAESC